MKWLLNVCCIFISTVRILSIDEKVGRKALLSSFLRDNDKAMRGYRDDKVLNNALKSQIQPPASFSDTQPFGLNILSDAVGTAACDSGWTRYANTGMCYKQSTNNLNWYAGEDWCWSQRAGAHLTSIHSQDESKWINAQFRTKKGEMDSWIGLRRDCDNVTYVWTDQSPTDFLWWQPEYPKSEFAEFSCVTLWEDRYLWNVNGYVAGQFDDMFECSTAKSKAICKYDPNTSIIGEKYVKKTCSKIPETTKSTSTSTTTPTTTTTTPTTTTTITTTTPTTTTTTPTTTTTAQTTTPTTTTPTTTTTTPSTTSTTTTTVPTTTTVTTSTVTTTVGTTTPKALTNSLGDCSVTCDKFWFNYRGACYGIVKGTSNYYTAIKGCNAFGGDIVSITDEDMNEAMRLALSTNDDTPITSQAWIGPSAYSNFAPGKPNQAQGTNFTDYCNVMSINVVSSGSEIGYSRGIWTDYPCTLTQDYVICKHN